MADATEQTQGATIRTRNFLLLNCADFILTVAFVQSGLGVEGNPLLAGLPLYALGAAKISLAFLVVRLFGGKMGIMRALNIGMGIVVLWNLFWFTALLRY